MYMGCPSRRHPPARVYLQLLEAIRHVYESEYRGMYIVCTTYTYIHYTRVYGEKGEGAATHTCIHILCRIRRGGSQSGYRLRVIIAAIRHATVSAVTSHGGAPMRARARLCDIIYNVGTNCHTIAEIGDPMETG